MALLATLERHVAEAEVELARILPATPFEILCTTPGWALVRAARYGAALGDPTRWPTARQVYRAAGLTPRVYESAGRRIDGAISREGSVELRGALLELGMGLWLCDPATRPAVAAMKARGKPAGVIACALANRANRTSGHVVPRGKPRPSRPIPTPQIAYEAS